MFPWLLLSIALFAACASTRIAAAEVQPLAPARWLPIGEGAAGSSINVVANRRNALFTHGAYQFAAYYDPDGFVVLARRALDSDRWQTRRSTQRGNIADAHNSISLALDGDGLVHVSWDHHGNALNYARSERPFSLDLGPRQSMTGVAEDNVTYPEFYALPDGDLLFLYRDGASGKGDLVLNRYSTRQRRWSQVQRRLVTGEGQRSAYWGAAVDPRGGVHLAWIWRDSPDVASNHDIAYAFSADGGVTWKDVQGGSLALPLTLSNTPYAARIPSARNLMNSPWITADAHGRPFILSYWSDAAGAAPQFRFLHRDSDRWVTETVTQRTEKFLLQGAATRRPPVSRGVLLVSNQGAQNSAHLIYRDDAHAGRVLILSTPSIGSSDWKLRELTGNSLGAWEPLIDPIQWERHGQIHLLAQLVEQRDGDDDREAPRDKSAIGTLILDPP